jgi:hypothetical protein
MYFFPQYSWVQPKKIHRNKYWENWGPFGNIIGIPLILFGILLSICEIVRIVYGPTHRGITNYGVTDNNNTEYPIGSASLLFGVHNDLEFPIRVEKFHYWPWTYAANLFGLVILSAGFAGVISAHRRSYTSIFTFLTLCLLSIFLSGYLIGYYSILLSYYINKNLNKTSDTMDTSYGLIITNLSFSCASCIFGIIGFITSFLGIGGCRAKG